MPFEGTCPACGLEVSRWDTVCPRCEGHLHRDGTEPGPTRIRGEGSGPRGPRTALGLVGLVATAALLVTAVVLLRDPPTGAGSACTTMERLVAGLSESPAGDRAGPASAPVDADRQLAELLLTSPDALDVLGGSFVLTHDASYGLDGHVRRQHDPAAREVATAHGFLRQASRDWTDAEGRTLTHTITLVSGPRNAEALNVHHARYSCRFATDVWSTDGTGPPTPVIGQEIGYQDGAVALQYSWTSGDRRHLLLLYDPQGRPDRAALDGLLDLVVPLDDGAPLR